MIRVKSINTYFGSSSERTTNNVWKAGDKFHENDTDITYQYDGQEWDSIGLDLSNGGDISGDLAIKSGSTEVIRFNNTNNVGSAPDILFDQAALVASEGSFVICIDSDDDSTGAFFQLKKDADTTSATEIMTIDEGGTMELSGDGRLYLSSNLPRLYLRENDTTDKDILVLLSSGTFSVQQRNDDESFNKILMKIETSGTVGDMLVLDSTEAVINQNGSDYDFRVEGDTETNLIFCDAGNDAVGIGESLPTPYRLAVSHNVNGYVARFLNGGGLSNRDGIVIQGGQNTNASHTIASFRDGTGSTIGSITADGDNTITYQTSSDRRIKEGIKALESLDLTTLRAVRYRGKKGKRENVGAIAQEIESILPDLVSENENGLKQLDYGRVSFVIAAQIWQQLNERLEKIENEEN